MKQISLKSIYLHSFKSFSEPKEIEFSQSPGLKYLGGRNLVDPRLGSNGSGKSTIWDALCWCLYGTAVRGQKASELASWGQTRPYVMVKLCIANEVYEILRQGSPNKLTINQKPSDQKDVDTLLGLSRDKFLQSVLFGQQVPLFLDLPVAARGELLEGVLDLSLWMTLSEDASRQATLLTGRTVTLEKNLSFASGKLAGIENEAIIEQKSNEWKIKQDLEINEYIDKIEAQENAMLAKQSELKELLKQHIIGYAQIDEEIQEMGLELQTRFEQEKLLNFYRSNEICPSCSQPLDARFKAKTIKDLEHKISQVHVPSYNHKIKELNEEKKSRINQNSRLESKISVLQSEIKAMQSMTDIYINNIEVVDRRTNPYEQRIGEIRAEREKLLQQISELEDEILELKGEIIKYDYWKQGFKKVRLFQIKQILLRLEIETANAASALGLGNWKINFVTETETKSGSTRPGIQVLVTTPQYSGKWEGFSGGETQRIRLAVTLGLASFIQGMMGVSYDFEVFDESSHYLSVEGVEDLLQSLAVRAEMSKKSIWVVDHTALSFSGFSEYWECVKSSDGSKLARIK